MGSKAKRAAVAVGTGGLSEVGRATGLIGGRGGGGGGMASPEQISAQGEAFRKERIKDLERGREAASERFADVQAGDLEDIIARRRQQIEGLTPEERNLMETQGLGGIQQAEQGALRQLRGLQGAAGVRGGLAGAQQADVLKEGIQARGDLQRDVVMQDIQARRAALDSLESTLGRERFGFMARELGEAGLGAAERGAAIQSVVGSQQAAAAGRGKK